MDRPQEVQDEIRAEDSVSRAGRQQQQVEDEQQQVEARQRQQEIHEKAQQAAQARLHKQAEYMNERDGKDRFPGSVLKTTRYLEALARSARISTQARESRPERSRSDRSRSDHGGRERSGRGDGFQKKVENEAPL